MKKGITVIEVMVLISVILIVFITVLGFAFSTKSSNQSDCFNNRSITEMPAYCLWMYK